jgi:uncharacterized repeat protein (TIGR03803 family)
MLLPECGQFFLSRLGTVFKMTPAGVQTTPVSFDGATGNNPQAPMVQGNDGSFYGTTARGGEAGAATVFRMTIVPEFQAVALTNNMLSLTWSTEPGARYQLQYNSELSSSNWINLNSPISATAATLTTTDFITNAPQRF